MDSTATSPTPTLEFDANFVGGSWDRSAASRLDVIDPAHGTRVGSAPDSDAADVDRAVRAARRAFDEGPWPRLSPQERAEWLERLADEVARRGGDNAAVVTAEMGQPIQFSRVASTHLPAAYLRYYAQLARETSVEQERPKASGPGTTVIRYEAVGVAALIIPWNFPQVQLFGKLAPALAAGCTTVIKPAPETPLDALLIARAAEAIGFPAGVINVVTGATAAGRALVEHDGVDKVSFTGSTAAGRTIATACAQRLIPVTLELGGKSAAIVLDDADLDETVATLRTSSFFNTGQTCFLLSRVLVPRARQRELTDALVAAAESLRIGDPRDEDTEIGPLASERIRTRVTDMVTAARTAGARVLTGGGAPRDRGGNYFAPTILDDLSPRDPIAQDEVFGPVVTVLAYEDVDDAVRIANDTRYGLGGAVFSTDAHRALEVARRVETGTIGVNHYAPDMNAPFGGVKDSGLGRELGIEGMRAFQTIKSVYL
ncbi:aldehyde dehydrogenase [Microbacterium sp.]|uniref:aldehyde dehydrogenase n=1 Tax=Microbacterium sp. TaxID=51671 RepID=UPI003A8735C8